MKASVVDLRYRMNEVLKALERGEAVTVLYRGTVKGTIVPHVRADIKVEDHPFFGSQADAEETVEAQVTRLRRSRTDGL